jgi:hypothetical protein
LVAQQPSRDPCARGHRRSFSGTRRAAIRPPRRSTPTHRQLPRTSDRNLRAWASSMSTPCCAEPCRTVPSRNVSPVVWFLATQRLIPLSAVLLRARRLLGCLQSTRRPEARRCIARSSSTGRSATRSPPPTETSLANCSVPIYATQAPPATWHTSFLHSSG